MRHLFFACLILTTCGDDVTADEACTSLAQGFCAKVDICLHPLVVTQYGDVATCVTRQKLNCVSGLKAPGNTATPAKAQSCGNAASALSCTDVFTHNTPKACVADPG